MTLNPKDKQQLARILYRCAMWVSISDEDGGRHAQNLEEKMLKKRLQTLYRQALNGSVEREILGIVLANSGGWKKWNEDLYNLISEINAASSIMTPPVKTLIMGLAKDVAVAFRERSFVSSFLVQMGMYLRGGFSKLNPQLSASEYASISINEKAALNELAHALDIENFNL